MSNLNELADQVRYTVVLLKEYDPFDWFSPWAIWDEKLIRHICFCKSKADACNICTAMNKLEADTLAVLQPKLDL